MKAETSITMYGTTWCHIPAESHHPSDCSENKSQLFRVVELFLPLQVTVSNEIEETWKKEVIMKYISINFLVGLQENHEDH